MKTVLSGSVTSLMVNSALTRRRSYIDLDVQRIGRVHMELSEKEVIAIGPKFHCPDLALVTIELLARESQESPVVDLTRFVVGYRPLGSITAFSVPPSLGLPMSQADAERAAELGAKQATGFEYVVFEAKTMFRSSVVTRTEY